MMIGRGASLLGMAVLETRGHTYRRRQSDDRGCAEEDDRVPERWYRFAVVASVYHPARCHHDIDLKQQSAEIRSSNEFRFSGVRAERRSRCSRESPQRDGPDVEHDPRCEHRRRHPSKDQSRPNQLEQRDRHEEQA
ncbi:hypothetical protein [Mycolicibacterium hodleri]|uniref:hypothetical protein n=1 Tax=Mycolicibacterium hodleri TaxID=49897 RepID=UPI00163C6272|nr:hypothetical protein [Mycolicibacterium hodleri]